MKTRRKIEFPNPYGNKLPSEEEVLVLQQKYGFSDSYAHFLLTQNGFYADRYLDAWKQGEIHPDRNEEINEADEDSYEDLFGVISGDSPMQEWFNLWGDNMKYFFLLPYFFPISEATGSSPFVEVLKGRYKGCIGQLDPDRFYGYESLHEWLYGFDEEDAKEYINETEDERVNRIESDGLLYTIWAPSMKAFTENCIYCVEDEDCYTVSCLHYRGYAELKQDLFQQIKIRWAIHSS